MNNMQVLEAFSRLKSLRQNMPKSYSVDMKFVDEFHKILDLLERNSGTNLQNFRIPDTEIRPIPAGGNYLTGEIEYTDEPYCDRDFFAMKVDGVLTMFELLIESPGSRDKRTIGFRPPSE